MGLFDFWKKKNQSKILLPAQKTKPINKIGQPASRQYRVVCEIVYKGTPLSTVDLQIKAPTAAVADKLVKEHVELKVSKIHQIKK
jgi:hypothetical protein